MTFDLSVAPVFGAGGGGSLPERGRRILAGGAGRLGVIPGRPRAENTQIRWSKNQSG